MQDFLGMETSAEMVAKGATPGPYTGRGNKRFYRLLGDKAGLSSNAVYRIFGNQSRRPNWDTACRIADALGISLDELRGMLERGRRQAA